MRKKIHLAIGFACAVGLGFHAMFLSPERSTEVGWTIIDRIERIIEPIEPTPCFRLQRYGRRIFRQKSSNDQKIARMARILTIFGPFEPHRRQLQFPKISNEGKVVESIESTDSIERSRDRSDRLVAAVETSSGFKFERYVKGTVF